VEVLKRLGGLALIGLAACERAPDPVDYSEPSAAIHAVIAAGSPVVGVLVARFTPGSESPVPVSGADVTFARGEATFAAREDPGNGPACFGSLLAGLAEAYPGCYAAPVPGGVATGDRWSVVVRFPTGEIATGDLVVPSPPWLLEPAARARVPVQNFGIRLTGPGTSTVQRLASYKVRWTLPSPRPPRSELSLFALRVFVGDRMIEGRNCDLEFAPGPETDVSGAQEVTVAVYRAECRDPASPTPEPLHWDSVEVRVAAANYDTAYARYVREVTGAESVRRNHAAAGVRGALGLFAGAAPAARTVVFVPAAP